MPTKQKRDSIGHDCPFRVGEWHVDPAAGRIKRAGTTSKIEPQVMDVLVYLAGHAGEVVSREELEAVVWVNRVVGYDALTGTILKLRKAFYDDPRAPEIIETVSKRGYRMVAKVETEPAAGGLVGVLLPECPDGSPNRGRYAALLAVTLLVAGLIWFILSNKTEDAVHQTESPPSIAVLPFNNLSGDPAQQYFADGITGDLITALSKIPGLTVMARDSTFFHQGENIEHIRQERAVRYILKGSVRKDSTNIRINAQLIDTVSGQHLWAEIFDASLEDTFTMQDNITGSIAEVLKIRLGAGHVNMAKRYTSEIEAYDLFLHGLDHLGRRTLSSLEQAESYFKQAIALDPGFARAYANQGLVHLRHAIDGWDINTQTSLEQAKSLVDRALELDDEISEVYFANAFIALFNREYETAIHSLNRALELNPSYADAYALLSWVMQYAGSPEQAESNLLRARQLNPHTPSSYLVVKAEGEFTAKRYTDAITTLENALEYNPVHPRTLLLLAASYAHAGRSDDASWTIVQLLMLHSEVTRTRLHGTFPFRDDSQLQHLLDGLEKAGLPE